MAGDAQSILITGAGSGLGKGAAIKMAQAGHRVIAAVEIWPQVSDLREEAQRLGVDLEVIKLDILDERDRAHAQRYDVDVLVNNAGIGATGPIAEIPVDYLRNVMEVNVFAALEFTQPFARKFAERGSGKIVFLSSMAGLSTYPFLCPYNASKHALEAVAQCMKDELAPYGVRVCTINPGPYRTGFNDRMYDVVDQWFDEETNFTKAEPIRDIQQAIAQPDGQFDPEEMIERMAAVIPETGPHKFRTMLPQETVEFCREYQGRMWDEEV